MNTFRLMYNMSMFGDILKSAPLTPDPDLYDVITQNGPLSETITYHRKIAHGPIDKNQSSKSGGAIDPAGLS